MAAGQPNLEEVFNTLAKGGDEKSTEKSVNVEKIKSWMQQAKVIDGKTITEADVVNSLKALKEDKLNFKQFNDVIDQIAKAKEINVGDIKTKLTSCGTDVINTLAKTAMNVLQAITSESSKKEAK